MFSYGEPDEQLLGALPPQPPPRAPSAPEEVDLAVAARSAMEALREARRRSRRAIEDVNRMHSALRSHLTTEGRVDASASVAQLEQCYAEAQKCSREERYATICCLKILEYHQNHPQRASAAYGADDAYDMSVMNMSAELGLSAGLDDPHELLDDWHDPDELAG